MPTFDYYDKKNKDLMPAVSEITRIGDHAFTAEKDGFTISYSNFREEDIWNASSLPKWDRVLSMKKRRGIGMWITGDNSNSVLVFQIPGGDYPIIIDFVGKKYIEIPLAQAAWSTDYWGWRMDTKNTNYLVNYACLGFGKLSAKTISNVKIEGIRALHEIKKTLINPIIESSLGSLKIIGTVDCDCFIDYNNEKNVTIYDNNWNVIKKLPFINSNFVVDSGWSTISIKSENEEQTPWLELQFTTSTLSTQKL
jgi:hypothetical protein